MKKLMLLIFALFTTLIIKAQHFDDSYDWYPRQIGIKGGFNMTTLNASNDQTQKIKPAATSKIGYNVCLSYWIPITQVFRPRIELSYDQLNSDVSFETTLYTGSIHSFDGSVSINQGSIALLPEVVFGKNIQFSLFAGFQISALLSAHENGKRIIKDSASSIVSSLAINQQDNTISESVDSGFLTGLGVRYRLSKKVFINAESRFRFGTSMVYGIYKPYYWGISAGLVYQL